VWRFWRDGRRWGWVDSRVPYIALLHVAYTLDGIYSAANAVRSNAQVSDLIIQQ